MSDDLARLIEAQPLCWLISPEQPDPCFTLLPLRPVRDSAGALTRFDGHFARGNPHVPRIAVDPTAIVLWLGAHSYVSPTEMGERDQAPTWVYAAARFRVSLRMVDAAAEVRDHLDALSRDQEHGRPDAWSIEEMGPRYDRLSRGVACFAADVLEVQPQFKLGQSEPPRIFDAITGALDLTDRSELATLMRTCRSRTEPLP
jgi:transcriptional regulator